MRPQAGDLMLKFNAGSITNRVIAFGQRVSGGTNSMVVHAGIMFDSNYIVESSGPGLVANDIRVQNAAFGYLLFRPNDPNLAAGAGTCAKMMFDIQKTHGNLSYDLPGAVMSLFKRGTGARSRTEFDRLFGEIISGRKHPFFCSHFVVYVYQFVAEQMNIPAASVFPYTDSRVNPSKLAGDLVHNGHFHEAGYLMPNER